MKKYIYCVLLLCAFTVSTNAQVTVKHTSKGALYTIFTQNTGEKIKPNDVITFNIIQKTDKDSVLASSYTLGHPVKVQVQAPEAATDPILANLMEILPLVASHDSLLIRISTDSLLKGHEESRPPFFPKGSYLNLFIKIVNVQTLNDAIAERNADLAKAKADEAVAANKYIADNKLVLTTTASGLKYKITKTAIKPRPLSGDTVYVNYAGRLLNGKVFDTSIADIAKTAGLDQPGRPYEPIKFVVGQSKVIAGWDEGLLLMNEGSKATFVIPSNLAYADQGSPNGVIPPSSTLVFDVELVKVVRVKHAPAAKTPVKKPLAKKHYPVKKKS